MWTYRATVVRWIDGDTVVLDIDLGFRVTIRETCRLRGINTPETHRVKKSSHEYKRGVAAKQFAESYAPRDSRCFVTTERDKGGKYGRTLVDLVRQCDEGGPTINERLVSEGHAVRA